MPNPLLKRLEEGKLYYSISEVCQMTGLEQHVLRYWESEFPQLRPKKNRSGNRAYRMKEIKIIRYIKYLLYEEMFTIPGAKKKMAEVNLSELDGQVDLLKLPGRDADPPERANPPLPPDGQGEPSAPGAEAIPESAVEGETGMQAGKYRDSLTEIREELRSLLQKLAPGS